MRITIELNADYEEDYNALLALLGVGRREVKTTTAEEPEAQECEESHGIKLPVEADEAPYTCDTAMPMDERVEEETAQEQEEASKVITLDKWPEILLAKRKELGLLDESGKSVGASMAEHRSKFNDFVKEMSAKYGAPTPKLLSPENLYKFVQEVFNKITFDPVCGFKVGEYPKEEAF